MWTPWSPGWARRCSATWSTTCPAERTRRPDMFRLLTRRHRSRLHEGDTRKGAEHERPATDGLRPNDGFVGRLYLTVADVDRSAQFYSRVFDGTVVRSGQPSIVQIANTWLILNVGAGPTDDKPSISVRPPYDLNEFSSFMNIRAADVASCYETWRARGAAFVTRAEGPRRRDPLLHAGSRRLPHRGRPAQSRLSWSPRSSSNDRNVFRLQEAFSCFPPRPTCWSSALARPSDRDLRYLNRNTWALVIVLSFPVGPMLYLRYAKGPRRYS